MVGLVLDVAVGGVFVDDNGRNEVASAPEHTPWGTFGLLFDPARGFSLENLDDVSKEYLGGKR